MFGFLFTFSLRTHLVRGGGGGRVLGEGCAGARGGAARVRTPSAHCAARRRGAGGGGKVGSFRGSPGSEEEMQTAKRPESAIASPRPDCSSLKSRTARPHPPPKINPSPIPIAVGVIALFAVLFFNNCAGAVLARTEIDCIKPVSSPQHKCIMAAEKPRSAGKGGCSPPGAGTDTHRHPSSRHAGLRAAMPAEERSLPPPPPLPRRPRRVAPSHHGRPLSLSSGFPGAGPLFRQSLAFVVKDALKGCFCWLGAEPVFVHQIQTGEPSMLVFITRLHRTYAFVLTHRYPTPARFFICTCIYTQTLESTVSAASSLDMAGRGGARGRLLGGAEGRRTERRQREHVMCLN